MTDDKGSFLEVYLRRLDYNDLVQFAIEAVQKLNRDRRFDGKEGMTVFNGDCLKEKLEEKAHSYLRHGHGFTVIGGDVAGLHYTNETEGWQYGNEKLLVGAKAFHNRLRKGEILGVLGVDEFIIVLENNPSVETIIEKIEQECKEWSARQDRSPLLFGFGYATQSLVDNYVESVTGMDRPQTKEGWMKVVSGGGFSEYALKQILAQVRTDKNTRVYGYYDPFIRLKV